AHAEFGDDVGAAVAAEANHLLIISVLRETDMKNSGNLRGGSGTGQHIFPEQPEGRKIRLMRPGPVFEFDSGLHGAVVSANDLRQTAGIAATANVFEK